MREIQPYIGYIHHLDWIDVPPSLSYLCRTCLSKQSSGSNNSVVSQLKVAGIWQYVTAFKNILKGNLRVVVRTFIKNWSLWNQSIHHYVSEKGLARVFEFSGTKQLQPLVLIGRGSFWYLLFLIVVVFMDDNNSTLWFLPASAKSWFFILGSSLLPFIYHRILEPSLSVACIYFHVIWFPYIMVFLSLQVLVALFFFNMSQNSFCLQFPLTTTLSAIQCCCDLSANHDALFSISGVKCPSISDSRHMTSSLNQINHH